MEIKIADDLKDIYPKIKIAFLEVRNVANKKSDGKLEEEKRKLEDFIRKNYMNIKQFEIIKNYNNFF